MFETDIRVEQKVQPKEISDKAYVLNNTFILWLQVLRARLQKT